MWKDRVPDLPVGRFIRALRVGAIDDYPKAPRRCPSCGAMSPRGILIPYFTQTWCPACFPRTLQCARCRQELPVVEFRTTGDKRLPCYCLDCDRARQREYYARKQGERQRTPPPTKSCRLCQQTLDKEHFFADQRYRDGLMHV